MSVHLRRLPYSGRLIARVSYAIDEDHMSRANTQTRYGSVAKTLHWITALGILTLLPLGMIATRLPYDTAEQLALKATVFSVHKTFGIVVFLAALARIVWAITQVKPAPLHPERKLEHWAAETVHWLLYGSLVIVPLSGWIHHAATEGFAPVWIFGQNLFFIPEHQGLSDLMGSLHGIFAKVLAASLVLHIAGALKHHVIDRDETLLRMLPGTVEAGGAPAAHTKTPIVAALVVWGAAVGLGATLGQFEKHGAAPQVAALEAVQSDWQVESGTLGLSIQQFGSEVSGRFADWTAQISFDDTAPTDQKGTVEVTVSIPSLELGTVADQAMGADYFDAASFPTGLFAADLFSTADGYEARGTLTIKDITLPLTLPFQLELSDNRAVMRGAVQLDRRDFALGANMTDEGQLGDGVALTVDLIANRAE
jgi:cytochrome b561/polyisoprenoid-binding protein YceI